ncbi:hypothetical protein [Azomonas macrocytogenes]|uniref:Lipoprotein n=1 Tax=Azomonas macrocytogenes TaxID=69962 RepID=A0A839T3L2_AZOMA|nr:hypothetical protein [Azomonas macrocytogenes]MBB3103280.1 hypothetical protein [Azomonas macrocytogenes]
MRGLMPGLVLLSLGGCSLWIPTPNPDQAWIDLQPQNQTQLEALAVDQEQLRDTRYFQVDPGSRRLDMRTRFTVNAANVGGTEPLQRDCRLSLEYADFSAGSRYRLVAGGLGFRPWAKLYDANNNLLARATERGCGGAS